MRASALFLFSIIAITASTRANESPSVPLNGSAVIREMNLARQHPERYAEFIQALRGNFRGHIFLLPGGSRLLTHEGVSGLDEAIRFLREVRPLSPLIASPGMSQAAAEHVADQAGGAFGHGGSGRSNPGARLSRHGTWSGRWGENISYGKSSARDIVIALIVDDGQRARKHRQNIFNPAFNYAGAAVGPHARYRTVCSIDFAGGYAERGEPVPEQLFAGN